MKTEFLTTPRIFKVGNSSSISIKDLGNIFLEADEQICFKSLSGSEFDIVKKNWGYYATPSMNKRLKDHKLSAALVRNQSNCYYVMLVEHGYEEQFHSYISEENQEIIVWFDQKTGSENKPCSICGGIVSKIVFEYHEAPMGEIRFKIINQDYQRRIQQCLTCSHMESIHTMNLDSLYSETYNDDTYGGLEGIKKTFQRILSLPPEKSDNVGRVKYVCNFWNEYQTISTPKKLLDIGSGLGVFVHRMSHHDWNCTALDPDKRSCQHIADEAGVETICGDFFKVKNHQNLYTLVSFNKVLEHVKDPIKMLAHSLNFLHRDGLVYIELPDGEMASRDSLGKGREEFFIDHYHIFSSASIGILAKNAGFDLIRLDRLQEPSTKYTLRAFLKPNLSS